MAAHPLNDSTAVLTGSATSIAFEIACQLAEAGVPRIVLNGRKPDEGAAACVKLKERAPGVDVRFVSADVATPEGPAHLVDEAVKAFGGIDILVTSIGGVLSPRPFHEIPVDMMTAITQAHLLSAIYTCHAALPHMQARGGGTIINLSSDAAKSPTPGETLIGACKAGVAMFSRTLSLEVSRHGIRVHCLTPSIVRDTKAYAKVMSDEFSSKIFAKAESRAKLGVVEPADLAALAVFLAGPGAARMTGQTISVTGGIAAN